jgi:DNA-binding transcriptional ArsR family regulator
MTASSSARARRDRTGDAARRPAVRDLTGGAGFSVEWDVRPVFDFVFSLANDAGSTDDLPPADRTWLAEARAALPEEIQSLREELFGSEVGLHIAAFPVGRPEIRTARQLVDALDATDPKTIVTAIFLEAANQVGLGDVIGRAMAGDPAAITELGERLPDDWRREDRLRILRDPAGAAVGIRRVLRAWVTVFEPIEERVVAMLTRDHAERAADRASLPGPDLIEKTTGGVRWLPEAGVRRAILAPLFFSRPYNILLAGQGWRFFGYPIADSALDAVDPMAPPQALIRLHRALGDETRLRILKLLSEKDLYLTEIAQLLELSKPTIKHHLALLRSAGLVTVTESGAVIYYTLRRQRLDDASLELKQFLVG